MKKAIKILSGIVGGIVVLIGLAWSVLEITTNHGINHLFDKEVKI